MYRYEKRSATAKERGEHQSNPQLEGGSLTLCSLPMGNHHSVSVNGRKLRVVKQLAEGGFAFVYVVRDAHAKETFALKRIHCSVEEQIRNAE